MMKKFRVFTFIFLTMAGFLLSLSIQAQTNLMFKNQLVGHKQPHWSLQAQQQADDDDVRERREEEIIRNVRPVYLDRPE